MRTSLRCCRSRRRKPQARTCRIRAPRSCRAAGEPAATRGAPAAPTAATTSGRAGPSTRAPVPAASSPDGNRPADLDALQDADPVRDGTSGTVQADAPADPARPQRPSRPRSRARHRSQRPRPINPGVPAGQGDAHYRRPCPPRHGHPRGDGRTGRTSAHAGHGRGAVTAPRAAEHGSPRAGSRGMVGAGPRTWWRTRPRQDQNARRSGGPGTAAARSGRAMALQAMEAYIQGQPSRGQRVQRRRAQRRRPTLTARGSPRPAGAIRDAGCPDSAAPRDPACA